MLHFTHKRIYENGIETGFYDGPSFYTCLETVEPRLAQRCRHGWKRADPHTIELTATDGEGDKYTDIVTYYVPENQTP